MKKTFLTIIALTLIIVTAKSQTTEEEYNYITKGYKVQLESGLDMKKGYSLKDLGDYNINYSDAIRGMTFKGLYRGADLKPCAIMAIYKKKEGEAVTYSEYYCIPSIDAKDLWSKTLAQLNADYDNENAKIMYLAMLWATLKFSAQTTMK